MQRRALVKLLQPRRLLWSHCPADLLQIFVNRIGMGIYLRRNARDGFRHGMEPGNRNS